MDEILSQEAAKHYQEGHEHERLMSPHGRLEFERSKDILLRNLFKTPAKILDIGGGTGHYAFWLANLGYEVHLVDAMESHIETAKKLMYSHTLASISVGDARATKFGDEFFDMVVMFGPLYHLIEKRERLKALAEANRVLKPGGKIFAISISKFASLYDGYFRGLIIDAVFRAIVDRDLKMANTGNPTNHPEYFTTAKFHDPTEFKLELQEAGFLDVSLHGVEGFGWLIPDLEQRMQPRFQDHLMNHLRKVETEPTVIGSSAHVMAIGRKWLEPREIPEQEKGQDS